MDLSAGIICVGEDGGVGCDTDDTGRTDEERGQFWKVLWKLKPRTRARRRHPQLGLRTRGMAPQVTKRSSA